MHLTTECQNIHEAKMIERQGEIKESTITAKDFNSLHQ